MSTKAKAKQEESPVWTWVLAVGAVALLAWLYGAQLLAQGQHAAKPWVRLGVNLLELAVVIALLVTAGIALLRFVVTRRTLRSRVTVAVIPAESFSPSLDAIQAFSRQLLGARRRVFTWLDRPACAVRILLTTTEEGQPAYLVQVPGRFRVALETAMSAYPGLELTTAAEAKVPELCPPPVHLKRIRLELKPARSDLYSLREIPHKWDPLSPLADSLAHVRSGEGEQAWVAIDLLPLAPRELVPLRRRLLELARRKQRHDLLDVPQDWRDRNDPAQAIERRMDRQGLWTKVGGNDPMFRLQVLIAAQGKDQQHCRGVIRRIQTALEQWSGQNYFKTVGLPLLGVFFFGADAFWRRGWFDWRLHSGRFGANGRSRVVSAPEVWGFLKPWTESCSVPTVLRKGINLDPPLGAAQTGRVVCISAAQQPVAIRPEDGRYHHQIIGPTGGGKTTLLSNWILDEAGAGRGAGIIDPKDGEAILAILERLPREHWDRVVLISPALRERPVGINVLECPDPEDRELVADQVVGIFARVFRDVWGARQADTMRNAVLTLMHTRGATLCDIPALLLEEGPRRRWTQGLEDPIGLEPFWAEYESLSSAERHNRIGPLLYKLREVLLRRDVRNMLGQSASTIDFGDIINNRKILLVDIAKGKLGEDTTRLIGSLLVARIWQTSLTRANIREQDRQDWLFIVDEFPNFVHMANTFTDVLAESRSLHIAWALAHQGMSQIPESVREALATNARTKIAFQLESDADARALAPTFHPLQAADLRKLARYQVAARVCVDGNTGPAFTGTTPPPRPSFGVEQGEELVAHVLERYGRPRAEVEAEILERMTGGRSRRPRLLEESGAEIAPMEW